MKETQVRGEEMPGTPTEETSHTTADPQAIDQTTPAIAQTAQENAQAREIDQETGGPTPPRMQRETETSQEAAGPELPVVLITPQEKGEVIAASAPQPAAPPSPESAQIHIAPNLLDLTTGRVETAVQKREARERRDLDQVVHSMLIIGLVISTILMLIGIVLEVVRQQGLPTVEPDFSQVFARAVALRPSGYLALGLLVLLATPILRVIGSIIAFAYERDWRFVGITFVVLMVVIASILLGKG